MEESREKFLKESIKNWECFLKESQNKEFSWNPSGITWEINDGTPGEISGGIHDNIPEKFSNESREENLNKCRKKSRETSSKECWNESWENISKAKNLGRNRRSLDDFVGSDLSSFMASYSFNEENSSQLLLVNGSRREHKMSRSKKSLYTAGNLTTADSLISFRSLNNICNLICGNRTCSIV